MNDLLNRKDEINNGLLNYLANLMDFKRMIYT